MIVPKRSIALSLYILSFIFTANNIYASLGKWKEIKPFYGTNVNVMAKHPSGKIFVGTTHDGVYVSDDGDKNWKQCYYYRTKTILQSIVSMAIDSSGVIYLGAEDDGIIKSSDEGRTWINCNFPASQENVFCVAINNEGYVFCGD